MALVDLHLHLLPAVDDGPATLAESVEHARRMTRAGVREAVVTPHVGHPAFPLDAATIAGRTAVLQRALDEDGIPLRLHPGGEVHARAAAHVPRGALELVAQGPAGARWVLLETPFAGIDRTFMHTISRVRSLGFGVVLAHPERAAGFLGHGLALLRPAVAVGVVLQVSVCSLMGRHGEDVRGAAEHLVRERLAYVIASDGHGGTRSHTLDIGLELATRAGASAEQARRLVSENPRFLLAGGVAARAARARDHAPG